MGSDFVTSLITIIVFVAVHHWLSNRCWLNALLRGFGGGGVFLLSYEASFLSQHLWLYPVVFLVGFFLYFGASRRVRAASKRGLTKPC